MVLAVVCNTHPPLPPTHTHAHSPHTLTGAGIKGPLTQTNAGGLKLTTATTTTSAAPSLLIQPGLPGPKSGMTGLTTGLTGQTTATGALKPSLTSTTATQAGNGGGGGGGGRKYTFKELEDLINKVQMISCAVNQARSTAYDCAV